MERREGSWLIELLLVIAIVALIAAFAARSLLAPRGSSNEARCRYLLGSLVAANEQYRERFGSYADSLRSLGDADLIDPVFAASRQSGYDFVYTASDAGWSCEGNPTVFGTTGERCYFIDDSGVIRFSTTGTASSADPRFEGPGRGRAHPFFHIMVTIAVVAIVADVVLIVVRARRKPACARRHVS